MTTNDTTPGSPRRAALKARPIVRKPDGEPHGPSVTLTESDLLHMTSAEIYNAFGFRPTVHVHDQDHHDTDAALNQAVRALVEAEMNLNPEAA